VSAYAPFVDPYVYPGTDVLKNRFGLTSAAALRRAERLLVAARIVEGMPPLPMSPSGYRGIHRHLFRDIYDWAGQLRTVNLALNAVPFAFPENLAVGLERCFRRLSKERRSVQRLRGDFSRLAADYAAELNALHPFRDGNGRTLRLWLEELARRAGFRLVQARIPPAAWNESCRIAFVKADTRPLDEVIGAALTREHGRPQRRR
jgi:cell filamentation protein